MEAEPFFFRIVQVVNKVELNGNSDEAMITQTVTVESDRAATLFVSQHIDGFEMIEAVRHSVEKGISVLELKQMRVIHPRFVEEDGSPAFYELGVGVMAAGVGVLESKEKVQFFKI